jgi:hypothetical protein
VYARYGLELIADPSADEALRAAEPTIKGNLLIGVINSIGKRSGREVWDYSGGNLDQPAQGNPVCCGISDLIV